jgi:hypothetical protein
LEVELVELRKKRHMEFEKQAPIDQRPLAMAGKQSPPGTKVETSHSLPSLRQEREPEEIISWATYGSRLVGALEPATVFVGKLPPLRVNQARLFVQNRLALFLETGSTPQRIPVSGESDTQDLTLPVNSSSTGSVSVEPLGRLRAGPGQYECTLTFALLPNCALHWPSGLFSPDDRPFVTFDGPPQVSVRLPECSAAAPGKWQIPARTAFVEGALQINTLSILLGHTVYRARFANDATPEKRLFDSAEFDTEFPLHLRGIPRTPIRAAISDSVNTVAFDLAQNFDAAGLKRVSSFAVRDPLKNYSAPAGTISIWGGRAWVASGAVLLNLSALSAWLFAAERDPAPPWLGLLDDTLSAWLNEALQAITTRAPVEPFECPKALPLSAQAWAEEIELMLLTFAEHITADAVDPFTTRNIDHLDPELIEGLRWVWAARGLVERAKSEQTSDAGNLIAQYPEKWHPPRTAWRQIMEDLLKGLRLQQNLDLMIEEWAAEARPPMRVVLGSRIGICPAVKRWRSKSGLRLLHRERGVKAPGPHLCEVFGGAEQHAHVARFKTDVAQILQKIGKQTVMGHAFEVDIPLFEAAPAAFHGRVRTEDFLIIDPDL